MSSTHPLDDLGAAALGALDPEEDAAVQRHVAGCLACARQLDAYREALFALASTAERPAPDLRGVITARAAASVSRSSRAALGPFWRRPVPAFVPAFLALLLLVSTIAVVGARQQADTYAAALDEIAGSRVVPLASAGGADVRGAIVFPASGRPYLLLRVPEPPSGRAWEAWVLRDGRPVAAGISTAGGVVRLTLTSIPQPGDGVALTQEAASGASAPTTAPVLVLNGLT